MNTITITESCQGQKKKNSFQQWGVLNGGMIESLFGLRLRLLGKVSPSGVSVFSSPPVILYIIGSIILS
jgi:hypothetical protein